MHDNTTHPSKGKPVTMLTRLCPSVPRPVGTAPGPTEDETRRYQLAHPIDPYQAQANADHDHALWRMEQEAEVAAAPVLYDLRRRLRPLRRLPHPQP